MSILFCSSWSHWIPWGQIFNKNSFIWTTCYLSPVGGYELNKEDHILALQEDETIITEALRSHLVSGFMTSTPHSRNGMFRWKFCSWIGISVSWVWSKRVVWNTQGFKAPLWLQRVTLSLEVTWRWIIIWLPTLAPKKYINMYIYVFMYILYSTILNSMMLYSLILFLSYDIFWFIVA